MFGELLIFITNYDVITRSFLFSSLAYDLKLNATLQSWTFSFLNTKSTTNKNIF